MAPDIPEGVLVIGRRVCSYDAQFQHDHGDSPREGARKFVNDQLATYQANPAIKYWEGHNEPTFNYAGMQWYALFEIERMKIMASYGLKCIIGNFASGTPPLDQWPAFMPAIHTAPIYKAMLGLHEYSCPWVWWMTGSWQLDPDEDMGDEGHTTLRYRTVYREYIVPAGAMLPLVITEFGIDPLVRPLPPGAPAGGWQQLGTFWREEDGRSDKAAYYVEQLSWYDEEIQKDSFVKGACIFHWGSRGWDSMEHADTAAEPLLIEAAEADPAVPFTYEVNGGPIEPPPPGEGTLVGPNKLANPGFEGIDSPGEWHRGNWWNEEYGNMFMPIAWSLYWHKSGQAVLSDVPYVKPECNVIPKVAPFLDPPRIGEGHYAFQVFRSFDPMYVILYQTVTGLEPGEPYEFGGQAHAWSNHDGFLHEGEGGCSAGVGCDAYTRLLSAVPPLNGNKYNDAIGNIVFSVGFNEADGAPHGLTTRWGPEAVIYNVFDQIPPVRFIADSSGEVLVCARVRTNWRFRNNDAYMDNFYLRKVDTSTGDDEYARWGILVPPGHGARWMSAAAVATEKYRKTISYSAQDLRGGATTIDKTVEALNPWAWRPAGVDPEGEELRKYMVEDPRYPGIKYRAIFASSPAEFAAYLGKPMAGADIALSQNDPRWSGADFGEERGGKTIGQEGCLLTAICIMIQNAYGREIHPPVMSDLFEQEQNIMSNDHWITNWHGAVDLFGVFDDSIKQDRTWSFSELSNLKANGWEVILYVSGPHFVYLESCDAATSGLKVVDPWSGQRRTRYASQVLGVRGAHVEASGNSNGSSEDPGPMIGVHGAPIVSAPSDTSYWLNELKSMGVQWYKALYDSDSNMVNWLRLLKENGITPIVRMYQGQQFPGRLNADLMARVAGLVDAGIEYVEIANEPNLTGEWKSGYRSGVDWHNGSLVETVAGDWWKDAKEAIRLGARPAFPAMAPTERGGINAKYSGVMWAEKIMQVLAHDVEGEMRSYLDQGKIWIATHTSPFLRPFDFNPNQATYRDDMCALGYKIFAEMALELFGCDHYPVIISTEGGAYSPEHMQFLGWPDANYTAAYWADRVVALYEFLAETSTPRLTAMCPWILTDQGVSDTRWHKNGWYDRRTPREAALKMKQAFGG